LQDSTAICREIRLEFAARRRRDQISLMEFRAAIKSSEACCDDARRLLYRIAQQFPNGLPGASEALPPLGPRLRFLGAPAAATSDL
jgi:hypothetical protein